MSWVGAFCIKAIKEKAMSNETDLDWLARNVHKWVPNELIRMKPCDNGNGTSRASWCYSGDGGFTKEQWLARRAELQNKPSWESAPEWAEFLAQDEDGEWKWLAGLPGKYVDGWTAVKIKGCCKGIALGDWHDTLEKRPEQTIADICEGVTSENRHEEIFDPFVSVEDAATEKQSELEMLAKVSHLISDKRHRITPSKYTKTIHGVSVDVYDVLQAWGVSNPALQHLIKKALQCGQRGHKDNEQDLQDIIDSAIRAKELG